MNLKLLYTFNLNLQFNIINYLKHDSIILNSVADKITLDKENILKLAVISKNAYSYPNKVGWIDIPNTDEIIIINPEKDTLRGFVYIDNLKKNIIISFKGTSLGILSNGSNNDRFNDNLFFNYNPFTNNKTYPCYKDCYKESLNYPLNYLKIADYFYKKLDEILNLEDKNVIMTGHSLANMVATYLALKYNHTSVSFNSPGGKWYFDKTNITGDYSKIYHYILSSDQIANGLCVGKFSWCYWARYIIETKCHIGNVCMINNNKTSSIFSHTIDNIINELDKIPYLPKCVISNCVERQDMFNIQMFESNLKKK